jgi:hypothetical protein
MLSTEQKNRMIDLYNQKCSISDIIKDIGIPMTIHNIYYILKKNGVIFNRRSGSRHNIIGKQFGYLTVLEMIQDNKSTKKHPWRAKCYCSNCGNNNFVVDPKSLIRGRTTSCGCSKDRYVKTTGKNSKQYTGYEGLSGSYWGKIKERAKK